MESQRRQGVARLVLARLPEFEPESSVDQGMPHRCVHVVFTYSEEEISSSAASQKCS